MIPGSTAKSFSGSTYELVEYTGLNWVIPAGEQKTLLVKSSISSATPASASTADTFIAFDLEGQSDIVATDKDGNSVNASGYAANGGNSTDASVAPNTDFGIAKYGSLAIVAASDTPDKSVAVMGTTDNEVSKFKLTGTDEAWYIEKFSVALDDGQGIDLTNRDNFSAVKIKYQTEAQKGTSNWTISTGKTFGSTASLAFSFGTGSDRMYVPKDDSTYATVLASIATYNGGSGAKSKVPFKMYPIAGSTDSFLAYGAQSGEQVYNIVEPASTGFNLHFVARSKPVFAKEAWSGGELELARFSITAVGYDVIFDGDDDIYTGQTGSASLLFDLLASSTDDATGALTLYDWNENIVASKSSITWGAGTATSVSFQFEVRDVTVPQDTTKTFHLDLSGADLADFQKTDEYIYLQLKNDLGGSTATGDATLADNCTSKAFDTSDYNIVYHDGSADEGLSDWCTDSRFGMPALIKNIGPLPVTFRTLRGTATP
jgi:hypothetical protein